MFHGAQGLVPLARKNTSAAIKAQSVVQAKPRAQAPMVATCSPAFPLAALPLAAMSFSGFGKLPDPSQFLKQLRQQKPSGKGRQGRQPRASGPRGASSRGGGVKGRAPSARLSAGKLGGHGAGGKCPLRGLGPLAALLPTAAARHLRCPSAITKMRGMVAGLGAVRGLRPQPMLVRGAALAAVAALGNVPAGAAREHTTKFSPAWFAAVHVTVPFVAMLRKAVLLPNWALLLTLAGSVAGQAAGARLERARLAGKLTLALPMPLLRLPLPCALEGRDEESVWPAFAQVAHSATPLTPSTATA